MESPNTPAMGAHLRDLGLKPTTVSSLFRTFNAGAEPFRKESEAHDARA
jgi:hypothetical protein